MAIKERIWELMQKGVKLTADESAGALDLPVLSVRPRVCELAHSKFLKKVSDKPNRRDNSMAVWTRT